MQDIVHAEVFEVPLMRLLLLGSWDQSVVAAGIAEITIGVEKN
jgi:hypothetical protein